MIEGLYRIDWSRLSHAMGPALDLPGLILGLLSPVDEDRDHAFSSLQARIWDQGRVYEAAVSVIPFLIQLVQNPLVADRDRLLVFLAHLANGLDTIDLVRREVEMEWEDGDPAMEPGLQMDRSWARAARRAVRKGIPAYLWCLEQPQAEIRSAAAYLLACFLNESQKLASHLTRRLGSERSPAALASLVLALGVSLRAFPAHLSLLEGVHRRGFPPLVRLAAALAIVRHAGEAAGQNYLVDLIDHLSDLDGTLAAEYGRLPWADGHMSADIALAVCVFGPSRAPEILPDLVRALDRLGSSEAVDIAYAMLYLAFGAGQPARDGDLGLTPAQSLALEALADSENFWQAAEEAPAVMNMFGLPEWPDGIRMLLAGAD